MLDHPSTRLFSVSATQMRLGLTLWSIATSPP
jgi:hypothetical protein